MSRRTVCDRLGVSGGELRQHLGANGWRRLVRDRLVAIVVTQQYLIGELSILLSSVAAVAGNDPCVCEVVRLRQEAETSPPGQLAAVAIRALRLIDVLCWDSLSCGDVAAFNDRAEVSGRLYEFGVCAGLLAESRPAFHGSSSASEVEQ